MARLICDSLRHKLSFFNRHALSAVALRRWKSRFMQRKLRFILCAMRKVLHKKTKFFRLIDGL